MKKHLTAALTVGAAAFLLGVMPAAAQGQGEQRGHPGAGAAASHEPMGMGSAMSNHDSANNSTARGPKTPDELLTQNTKLSSNLAALLPTGTDLQLAAQGFKNLGQFVAAVHVSHNLGIPFACLKSDMTDTAPAAGVTCPSGTGTGPKALIQALKPAMTKSDVKSATKTATHQAKIDTRSS
jgi:hypothetical protein